MVTNIVPKLPYWKIGEIIVPCEAQREFHAKQRSYFGYDIEDKWKYPMEESCQIAHIVQDVLDK